MWETPLDEGIELYLGSRGMKLTAQRSQALRSITEMDVRTCRGTMLDQKVNVMKRSFNVKAKAEMAVRVWRITNFG